MFNGICKDPLTQVEVSPRSYGFTLAECTPCRDICNGVRKCAFTLAEVLITLAIIGVVAAITIPALITTINGKVAERQIQVAEKRLAEGVRLYSQLESGFNGRVYESTYDFLANGLSKHFKMTSICDADHIADCWPNKVINVEKDGVLEAVDVSQIKTPEQLNLDNEGYYTPASFISGAGVPYIMVLKKNCVIDPDSRFDDNDAMTCLDGLWDYSGPRTPNKLGKDVQPLADASINVGPDSPKYYKEVNGVRMAIKPFYPTAEMAQFASSNCTALKAGNEVTDTDGLFGTAGANVKLTDTSSLWACYFRPDYWLASKLKCESMGYRLPTKKELAQIAAKIYNYSGNVDSLTGSETINGTRGDISEYGFELYGSGSDLKLWYDRLGDSADDRAYCRNFKTDTTWGCYAIRNEASLQGVCVAD